MSLYFKFPRPGTDDFFANRAGYLKLLVPPSDHPTEKNCYAVINIDQLELFLDHFGDLGEIILEDEMPDIGVNKFSQKDQPFRIIVPRD